MKKFFTLLSAMLFIAAGAWAETFTGTVGFNAQNRMTNNGDGTFSAAGNAGNQYALALADLSGLENIGSASSVTVEFNVNVDAGARLLIGIGDKTIRGTTANGSNKSTYNTDGLIMRFGAVDNNYYRVNGGTNNSDAFGGYNHVKVTLDRINKKYSYTITSEDGATTYFNGSDLTTEVSNLTIIEAYTWQNSRTFKLSNASYSYEYTASSYDYNVNAVDANGELLTILATGTSTEAVSVYVPLFVNANGTNYKLDAQSYQIDVDATNKVKNVKYTEFANLAAYLEIENGNNCTPNATPANYSNGKFGHVNGGKTSSVGTLQPGKYTAYAYLVERGDRGIYLRDTSKGIAENEIANMGTNKYSTVGIYSCDFTITEETNVGLSGWATSTSTNQSSEIDYVYIVKTGDLFESITVNDNGTASYVTKNALDFAGSTLKAYVATAVSESAITLEEVTTVAAGQAIVVKGESCDVNVIAEAAAPAVNLFQSGAMTVAEGQNVYALSKTDGQFHKVDAGVAIPAGKAYIVAGSTSAKTLALDFGGEATGISNATVAKQNAAAFNLMGQKVNANAKGIVIINGKKFNNK